MNVSDLLNPSIKQQPFIQSVPYENYTGYYEQHHHKQQKHQYTHHHHPISKPRSRFSLTEDNIILEGVAQKLTWGQISERLPNRKRATCFNRYRTLQGRRKSRHCTTAAVNTTADNSDTSSFCSAMSPVSPAEPSFFFNESTSNRILSATPPPLHINMYQRKEVHFNQKLSDSNHSTFELVHHTLLPPIYSYSPYSL